MLVYQCTIMKIEIEYQQKEVSIELPEKNVAGIVYPNKVTVGPETETLLHAVEHPVNSVSFDRFLAGEGDILFIVNDGTRPTPTAKVLEAIYDKVKDRNIRFIIATGMHRASTEEELQFIFGKHYEEFKDRVIMHDAKKDEDMVFIGTSSNGTEMRVNKHGVEASRIVVIGSVEPHYFAGFTGGRKAFLPGIAAYKTIEQNHKYALKLEAQGLALEGNPVHEDMVDALQTVKDKAIFSIQTVLDRDRKIYAVTAGHIKDSFDAAIDKAKEVFCVPLKEKADIVVSIAPYPMDVDLYQSQKALDNGKLALKEGGILIMVSECRDGVGPPAFFKLLSSSVTPEETLKTIGQGYKLGYHKAAKMAEISTWAEMWGVTGLDDGDMNSVFIKPFPGIQEAVDAALKQKGPDAEVIFLMEGSITVPLVQSSG